MEPWYRVVTLRKEVGEGRPFNSDAFAIALEHVVAGTAPKDYRDPDQFFARTCWTRALRAREHGASTARGRDGERGAVMEFRGVVFGQLGEPRLVAAIDADMAVKTELAASLEADVRQVVDDLGLIDKVQIKPE